MPSREKHPDEEVVDALVEQFFVDLKTLFEWSQAPGGRPLFARELADTEQWANFVDPVAYGETLSRLDMLEKLGLEPKGAQRRYWEDMMRLAAKLAKAERA